MLLFPNFSVDFYEGTNNHEVPSITPYKCPHNPESVFVLLMFSKNKKFYKNCDNQKFKFCLNLAWFLTFHEKWHFDHDICKRFPEMRSAGTEKSFLILACKEARWLEQLY